MNPHLYLILGHHDIAEPHYDLMFETSPGSDLATWRSTVWPIESATSLIRLRDHRRAFLNYEGQLTGLRGSVCNVSPPENTKCRSAKMPQFGRSNCSTAPRRSHWRFGRSKENIGPPISRKAFRMRRPRKKLIRSHHVPAHSASPTAPQPSLQLARVCRPQHRQHRTDSSSGPAMYRSSR